LWSNRLSAFGGPFSDPEHPFFTFVIPAKAESILGGIQRTCWHWIPVFTGMTLVMSTSEARQC